jgi:hypothetical protein
MVYRNATSFLLVISLLLFPSVASPQGRGVLREGTNLTVRLVERIDSDVNQTDDPFEAILDQDLVSDGTLLARAGSAAWGRLVTVEPSGRVSGRARISLTLTGIQVGSSVVPIDTNTLTIEADPSRKRDIGVIGGGTALGAIIGAIAGGGKGAAIGAAVGAAAGVGGVLVMGGKDVEFDPEQRFNFVAQRTTTFDARGAISQDRINQDRINQDRDTRPSVTPRGPADRIETVARELDTRAQSLWQMARTRREDLRNLAGSEGTDLYFAVSDFASLTQAFQQNARDFRPESLQRTVRTLLSHAQEISQLVDRVNPSWRFQEEWRGIQDLVNRVADAFNVSYAGARELPRYDRNSTGASNRGQDNFRWQGRVDGSDYIQLRGNQVTIRHMRFNPITDATYDLQNPLPRRAVNVRLTKLRGRGRVELYEQPTASNGYTASVYIEDEGVGSDFYEFELTWY